MITLFNNNRYCQTLSLMVAFVFCVQLCMAQWTEAEISKANTAANISYLTQEEKNIVLYVNLVRMYPQKFLQLEILNYENPEGFTKIDKSSYYYTSLITDLRNETPTQRLIFDENMYNKANCWAEEMGRLGVTGHNRQSCSACNCWECCQYGFSVGRDIVIALLIDYNVPNLGHRKNLLNKIITTVGVSIQPHNGYRVCSVIDSDNKQIKDPIYQNHQTTSTSSVNNYNSTTYNKPANNSTITNSEQKNTQSNKTTSTKVNESLFKRYYSYSGSKALSIVQVGYTFDIPNRVHMVNMGINGYRYKMFKMNLLQFEMGVAPLSKSFGWKPTLEVLIPISKSWAVGPYVGASCDITYIGGSVNTKYTYNPNNFYAQILGGISFLHNGCKYVPLQFFGEYRYTLKGTPYASGFYTGIRFDIGIAWK